MKRITRVFSLIAVMVALLLAGGAVPPVAATSGVTVSIDAPAMAEPGSDFNASIGISNVADFDACNYDVSFDASVLQLDDVASGLIGSTTVPVDICNELSPGTYRVVQNVPGLSGATGSGYLAVLHFHVIGSAGDSSRVDPSKGVLSDITAGEIAAIWVEGAVAVVTEVSQAAIVPPAAHSSPEATPRPPESTGPASADASSGQLLPPSSPSAGSGGVPVLWLVIGGVVLLGIIILFVVARMRAY
jgi:hypothetical protein